MGAPGMEATVRGFTLPGPRAPPQPGCLPWPLLLSKDCHCAHWVFPHQHLLAQRGRCLGGKAPTDYWVCTPKRRGA